MLKIKKIKTGSASTEWSGIYIYFTFIAEDIRLIAYIQCDIEKKQ